ncbi:hypothetical protein NA57DRAFT_75271 [Rhizodiscina lignyota]|uniref:Uncharacterized protein n=1 Tax=Rhizodiscina lignyota TaxID=1504668 RepID=A0A9P4IJQ7_9PEZI|nr:hypothetical protein NA57DRAFT_75271 [Rhizodiscina lignyota]
MFRKFIYIEYYEENDRHWAENPSLQDHADHCVDILRQVLMCNSDTGLIMYHWFKGRPAPMPDFSTVYSTRAGILMQF